jgi:hypothetical protein
MERVICDAMFSVIEKNSILAKDQFGFVPHRSTTLQLLSALEKWTNFIDRQMPVDILYVDFAKAFDSVIHTKLFAKLEFLGFAGTLLLWIKDFLIDRTHHVVVDSAASSSKTVLSGVPQGSVLGPLLFVLFLNDLNCSGLLAAMDKYADDVKQYGSARNVNDHKELQEALASLSVWSENWQLPIAVNKCQVLHIGRNNQHFTYDLSGSLLRPLTSVKDLGVWFSADLKFSIHCNAIVRSANQRSAMIRRCFASGDPSTLIWAYKVYIRPLLEYASPVWSPHLLKDIDCVEGVQRRFTRSLIGFKQYSYKERLSLAGLDSLELRRLKADLAFTYSIIHGKVDIDPSIFFNFRTGNRTRGHNFKLTVNKVKLDCRKFFFANRVVAPWNNLPKDCVNAPSLQAFKNAIKKFDFSKFLLRF